jgi:hypothetical protein
LLHLTAQQAGESEAPVVDEDTPLASFPGDKEDVQGQFDKKAKLFSACFAINRELSSGACAYYGKESLEVINENVGASASHKSTSSIGPRALVIEGSVEAFIG